MLEEMHELGILERDDQIDLVALACQLRGGEAREVAIDMCVQRRQDRAALGAAAAEDHSEGGGEAEAPDEFLCPITFEIMTDPVICADTISYER